MRLRRRPSEDAPDTTPDTTPASTPGPRVVGMVEEFSRRLVTGWVSAPADAPPTKVTLHLGKLQVSATYATADAAMSGRNGTHAAGAPVEASSPTAELGARLAGAGHPRPGGRPPQQRPADPHVLLPDP